MTMMAISFEEAEKIKRGMICRCGHRYDRHHFVKYHGVCGCRICGAKKCKCSRFKLRG